MTVSVTCDAVQRELSAPSDAIASAALQSHLAVCGICADYAASVQAFDALWEQTRPTGLEASDDPNRWSTVWAATLEGVEATAPRSLVFEKTKISGSGGMIRSMSARLAIWAQAAVLLLTAGLTWVNRDRILMRELPVVNADSRANMVEQTPPVIEIVVNSGQLGFLHLDRDSARFENTDWEDVVAEADPTGEGTGEDLLAADFHILNHMEGLAP